MTILKTYFTIPFTKHALFWICVFLYFVLTSNMDYYSGYPQVIEFNTLMVFIQIVIAYSCLNVLIPRFLNKKKYLQFGIYLLLLLLAMFVVYNLFKVWYYDPKYYEVYNDCSKRYAKDSFMTRFTNVSVFLSKSIKFLTPTALLLIARFYKNQQQFLQLKEQKKTAELSALKHQLNPHFLFNTLNNIYSLALEKSDKTPEVIERLSDILDYILYRCKDKYVLLEKELELVENYLALEKIRYGKRVEILFKKDIQKAVKIAPLILLTFIENAFKHGVSQELKQANIDISVRATNDEIVFSISNTKPQIHQNQLNDTQKEPLGLKNVKKQLSLLYPHAHDLQISNDQSTYLVTLILKTHYV